MIKTEELLDLSRTIYKQSPNMYFCDLIKILDDINYPEVRKIFWNLWYSSKHCRVYGKFYERAINGIIKTGDKSILEKIKGYIEASVFVTLSALSAACLLPEWEMMLKKSKYNSETESF